MEIIIWLIACTVELILIIEYQKLSFLCEPFDIFADSLTDNNNADREREYEFQASVSN